METLTAGTLTTVLTHCRDYPDWCAVIVVRDNSRMREFLKSMKECLNDTSDDDVVSISRSGNIKFKNGSIIRTVLSDSRARGIRCHEVIYDDKIEEDGGEVSVKINKIIYHCREEPVTLDNFLSEFKIV